MLLLLVTNHFQPSPTHYLYQPQFFAIHSFSPTTNLFFSSLFQILSIFVSTDQSTMGGEERKVFTLADVSKHNSAKDCWLVIHNKVMLFFLFFFCSCFIFFLL